MCIFPADFPQTFSQTVSNVRRNPFLRVFSLKINAPFLITQGDIIDTFGTFINVKMPIMPKMPHVFYLTFHLSVFTFHFSPFLYRRDNLSASISARA